MFTEFMGLPLHPLLVHASVVFLPLLVLVAIAYAFLPGWRGRIGWAAMLLSVAAPASALFSMLSGEELKRVLIEKNYPPEIMLKVAEHQWYGERALWFSFGLGVATLLMLLVSSGRFGTAGLPRWVGRALSGVIVVLGGFTGFYVFMTGDTGAQAVWQGTL